WVSTAQLQGMAGLSLLVLALWFGLGERLGRAGFYLLFALAVTASVQLVGVYLVFASLIMPALVVRRLGARGQLAAAYGLGATAYGLGLAASAWLDWPSGAVVVLSMAALGLVFCALWPGQTTQTGAGKAP
ncbi:MAG TPA: metal ABC transporter permease, partial [Aquabacterium sp.]|nr:metal ABC transporter permease [Aquabacterium sp.]